MAAPGPRLRTARLGASLVVLVALVSLVPPSADSAECEPGDSGCLPTPEQCASGGYNGLWDGGTPGRFAFCLGAQGSTLGYIGGTAAPQACGHVMAADTTIPPTGGDPNDCFPPDGASLDGMAATAAALGLRACTAGETSTDTPPTIPFVSCSGEMRTFDGLELDARLTFPADAVGPIPLVLLLHGWGGNRLSWQATHERTDVLGRGRFLAEGFATLATTARGFWASCGQFDPLADVNATGSINPIDEEPTGCARGWTHIAEREFEGRDSQTLMGQLVDAGIAHPDRLAVLGDSYGGGQAWLLATALPWETPGGRRVQLAAAVPMQGWTDLLNALAPNGRADDRPMQAAGTPQPLGILKTSIFSSLWASGRLQPGLNPDNPVYPLEAAARYNTVDPTETHSFMDGWLAAFNAGELSDSAARAYMEQALAGKSAMWAEDYFAAVAAGEVEPTPVLALQGWSDWLFPPVETVRMYRRLKQIRGDYPVHIALADGGHFSEARPDQWGRLGELAAQFVTVHLSPERKPTDPGAACTRRVPGRGVSCLPAEVTSMRATCDGTTDLTTLTGANWDAVTPDAVTFVGEGTQRTTWLTADPLTELALDPVVAGRGCVTLDHAPEGSARWSWDVPDQGLETVGLQRVAVEYSLTGIDATLIARLWEVTPAGTRTLVTSGVYRLTTLDGDPTEGAVDFAMFGTHWRFQPGNEIELELSQTDAAFLRPHVTPSALDLSSPQLILPHPGPGARGVGPARSTRSSYPYGIRYR